MPHRHAIITLLALATITCATRAPAQDTSSATPPSSLDSSLPTRAPRTPMQDIILRFTEDESSVSRFYNVRWSESRLERLDRFYAEQLFAMSQIGFDSLDQPGKIDYLLLRNYIRAQLWEGQRARADLKQMAALLPFREALVEFEENRWRMTRVDPKTVAEQLTVVADQARKARTSVDLGRKPNAAESELRATPVIALRAAGAVSALRNALRTWYDYHEGYQPEFSWWVKKPYEDAAAALDDYARFLRQEIAGLRDRPDDPLVGDPIGRDAILQDLKTEFIPYSPEELIEIANKEFAWCEAQMLRASRDMGLGDDWRKAQELVKESHVPPGEQDDLVAQQSKDAIRFLKDRDLLTIPPLAEELWRLTMITPATQRVLPFAAYNDQHMMVAYPTDDMPHADKRMSMRGNNRHFSKIVVPHELIPGHHLQLFMARRYAPHRALFRTPFFVEGWALYWEMKLWDLNYADTPQDRIGMLFWRMHRCARIIVSLKYHLGQMSPDEMISFLVDRVGHERFTATSEVRRYVGPDYSPLYQVSYMIGGQQLRALHHQAVTKRATTLTEKQFNDAVLRENSIPMELVRASILNTPLKPDSEATWRFADELPQ
jgi:uncharacterized protein (DUF885 family)